MNLPEYLMLELHDQQAAELAQAALRRAELKHICVPPVRQQFAQFLGRHFVQLGKRLLAYGSVAGSMAMLEL